MTLTIESILLSLASGVVGGLIVAVANHWMTKRREIQSKNRDIAVTKLVDAWLDLESASNKPNRDKSRMQDAVRTILLLGEDKDIDELEELLKNMAKGHNVDGKPLIVSLRDTIRKRLGLSGRKRYFLVCI